MTKTARMKLFMLVMLLVLALNACASRAIGPASTQAQPAAAMATATTEPVQNPLSGSTTAISCDQLIPPDEAKSLFVGLTATLSEQTDPGQTTCTWQYTSKSSGQTDSLVLIVDYGSSASDQWTSARQSELSGQPSDLVVGSIDGLGEENYTWISKPDNHRVVYVRQGAQTLIIRYPAMDILFLGTESGIIDMADRIFNRMSQ